MSMSRRSKFRFYVDTENDTLIDLDAFTVTGIHQHQHRLGCDADDGDSEAGVKYDEDGRNTSTVSIKFKWSSQVRRQTTHQHHV